MASGILAARVVGRDDHDVGPHDAAHPIGARLVGSRSPPHPNTAMTRPCLARRLAGRLSTDSRASGVWA